MVKKTIVIIMVGLLGVSVWGCGYTSVNDKPNDIIIDTETKDEELTIFDNIIVGTSINEIESLYDITEELEIEGYEIITSCPYSENEILVVYSGEDSTKIMSHNISTMKNKYDIEMEDVSLSADLEMKCVTKEFAYILDKNSGELIYIDVSHEEYEIIQVAQDDQINKIPKSVVVMDEGEQCFYTVDNDYNIYQYNKEIGNSFSVFDASGQVDSIEVCYVIPGGNTLIVDIVTDEYSGYARVSLENQELLIMEDVEGELLYGGDLYAYKSTEKPATLVLYNPMTPRLTMEFSLEKEEELNTVTFFEEAEHILSYTEDREGTTIRFYNVSEGIMENIITIPTEYEILLVDFYAEKENVLVHTTQNNNYKVLIWNTQIIEKIIK